MWPVRTLLFAVCLLASAALPLQRPWGKAKAPKESVSQHGPIPKYIWVTGEWKSDSKEVTDQMAQNIGGQPLRDRAAKTVQAQMHQHFAKWAPLGSYIRYFTDEDMDDAVRNISTMLAERGINDVAKGYFNLRPGAYRADLWRLMQLWAEGGVYLDANINLTCSLNDWIDFSNDELVLVTDDGVKGNNGHDNGFWQAMMAAEPRNQYIESAIMHISRHVLQHYYGTHPTAVTGPIALKQGIIRHRGYPKGIRNQLHWNGENVSSKFTGTAVATKDEQLHDKSASKHYGPMWYNRQVYCDQAGPDNGKCPSAPTKSANEVSNVSQCSTKFGIDFCNKWCNKKGFWPCGINRLDGSDGRNTDDMDHTCSCSGCNGCP